MCLLAAFVKYCTVMAESAPELAGEPRSSQATAWLFRTTGVYILPSRLSQ